MPAFFPPLLLLPILISSKSNVSTSGGSERAVLTRAHGMAAIFFSSMKKSPAE